jgi:enamine deaminase RidA (YjgF/YER057c/UK114 family)
MKQFRNPKTIHPPLAAYSHQIEVTQAKRWLVLSGQVGMRADGSLPEDPIEQFKVALDNIHQNLQAAGLEIGDVVKLTVYLAGEMDSAKRREALAEWLGGHAPCSTLLYVAGLATPNIKVEIDAWACE